MIGGRGVVLLIQVPAMFTTQDCLWRGVYAFGVLQLQSIYAVDVRYTNGIIARLNRNGLWGL